MAHELRLAQDRTEVAYLLVVRTLETLPPEAGAETRNHLTQAQASLEAARILLRSNACLMTTSR